MEKDTTMPPIEEPKWAIHGLRCRILTLAIPFFLVGCSSQNGQMDDPSQDSAPVMEESEAGTRAPAPAPIETTITDLKKLLATTSSEAVLINVWATWCIPCREEFPDLVRLRQEYKEQGFEVFFVSADFDVEEKDLISFLTSQGVDFTSYLKVGNDMDFIDGLHPDWSGALPASFLFDGTGHLEEWWEGKISYEDLKRPIVHLLNGKDDA